MDANNTSVLICHICGHPVTVTICTVDENGHAVHEECYSQELRSRFNTSLIFPTKDESDSFASLAFMKQIIPFAL